MSEEQVREHFDEMKNKATESKREVEGEIHAAIAEGEVTGKLLADQSGEGGTHTQSSLAGELRELGRQLAQSLRGVAGSDELRNIGRTIVDGFRDVGEEIERALERARESEDAQRLADQAKRVASTATGNKVVHDVTDTLGEALRTLNTELNKLVDRVGSRAEEAQSAAQETVAEATSDAQAAVDNAKSEAKEAVDHAKSEANEAAGDVADAVRKAGDSAEKAADETADRIEG